MFTGIIDAVSPVQSVGPTTVTLRRPKEYTDVTIGSSIAVAGVCLSVTELTDDTMSFDIMQTTLQKTTLGSLRVGQAVNLERAMRADARFEGHIVQGHVDDVGTVRSFDSGVLTVEVPENLLPLIVLHGSVTVDGVSLTVSALNGQHVSVSLIPHTLATTTLGSLVVGGRVNIETDILGKYILQSHGR